MLSAELPAGPGLFVCERQGLGIATVIVRRGLNLALAERVRARVGLQMPSGLHRTTSGDWAFVGTGPGVWLATQERGGNNFAGVVREAAGDLASISDQSDSYVVLRLSGVRVRDTLCKLLPIDLHPGTFRVGDVAVTTDAHFTVTIWRLESCNGGDSTFDLAIPRSFSEAFCRALLEGAREWLC